MPTGSVPTSHSSGKQSKCYIIKFMGAYQIWMTWSEARHSVSVFPAKTMHLALYLRHLSVSLLSTAAAVEEVHALSWLHEVAGLESVGTAHIVQATLGGV